MSSTLVSQTNSAGIPDDQLGINIGDIATGVVFGPAGFIAKNILGRSTCSGEQKQQKQQIAQAIDQLLTYRERRDLVRGTESDISPTGASMADFFLGGRDCKHKNVSPGDQRFLDNLPRVLEQKAREQQAREEARRQASVPAPSPPDNTRTSGPVSQMQTQGQQTQQQEQPAAMQTAGSGFDFDPVALWIGGTILVGGLSVILMQNKNQKRN